MTIIRMLIFSILVFQMNHLFFILIFGALFYFFSSPVVALGDSLAQRQADLLNISFGSIRTWGSIGFALSSQIGRASCRVSVWFCGGDHSVSGKVERGGDAG